MSESDSIAIVGFSGRFPDAPDAQHFWNNLLRGVECVTRFTDEELLAAGVSPDLIASPAYVKAGGVLTGIEDFDAAYFGLSHREAQAMDPQHRLFLECAVDALEHAGVNPDRFPGAIGVFGGVGVSTYLHLLESQPDLLDVVGGLQVLLGTNKDNLTTQVSYRLNLRGPSVAVQTACSTSLVAVAMACQSLVSGQCDAALAGGVSIAVPQREGYLYEVGGIDSPDGRCRAFDARADGTVGGNGVGLVVLKRFDDAVSARDCIHAVIRGWAINNDGAQKIGYTAPSIEGQAEVIALAHAVAGVSGDSIGYVEAHGTGTPLGDPIEVAALTKAFRRTTSRTGYCALGSVKTNIGHLDCAAGVAGLIKATLAVEHGQIPASLNFQSPNPRIDFAGSPFFVNTALRDWPAGPAPRRAGVSSFGIGGTNAHVVIEQAPDQPRVRPTSDVGPAQLLILSARSRTALDSLSANLAAHLRVHPRMPLEDVAYTLQRGRRALEHRRTVVCRSTAHAAALLEASEGLNVRTNGPVPRRCPVIFLFPGQGAQHLGMMRGLYSSEPQFRRSMDECLAALDLPLASELRALLLSQSSDTNGHGLARIHDTEVAQPALVCVEYALARVWMSWGLLPHAMLGHSVGEYTAACLAGVFDLETCLRLVAARGRLVQRMPAGSMLAVMAGLDRIPSTESAGIDVAAINAPDLVTLAGPPAAIDAFVAELQYLGIASQRLRTSHAFHSRALDPMLDEFRHIVESCRLQPPTRQYISNVTGAWMTAEQATDPAYYVEHLRRAVLFSEGVRTLAGPGAAWLEVGPGHSLSNLVRRQLPPSSPGQVVVSSLASTADDPTDDEQILDATAQLWLAGVPVDWSAIDSGGRILPLPTYAFERRRHWVDAEPQTGADAEAEDGVEPEATGIDGSASVRTPECAAFTWTRSPHLETPGIAPAIPVDEPGTCWLVIGDEHQLSHAVLAALAAADRQVAWVRFGDAWQRDDPRTFVVRAADDGDYDQVMRVLASESLVPRRVLHLGSLPVEVEPESRSSATSGGGAPAGGRFRFRPCPLHLRTVAGVPQPRRSREGRRPALSGGDRDCLVVVAATQSVTGFERILPEQTTVVSAARVVSQEYPNISCRVVDLEATPGDLDAVARRLLRETVTGSDAVVAFRGPHLWVQAIAPVDLPLGSVRRLRQGGVYLITGGLGRIGLTIARRLAEGWQAHLVLTTRSTLPPRSEWPAVRGDADSDLQSTMDALERIEQAGGRIDVRCIGGLGGMPMAEVVDHIHTTYGRLDGVFHCAGATEARYFAPIIETTAATFDAQCEPKVFGVQDLARALDGQSGAFCVLMSSISTVLGGLGFAAYAAANQFMDAYATERAGHCDPAWISIGWDGWGFDPDIDGDEPSLDPLEATEILLRIVESGATGHLLVSAGSYESRSSGRSSDLIEDEAEDGSLRAGLDEDRPRIGTDYRAPESSMECDLVALWGQLLGLRRVGVDDDFIELGGQSLVAIQLAARLRERTGLDVSPQTVFDAPTVARLAAVLEAKSRTVSNESLEDLLAQVEDMSAADVEALLHAPNPDGGNGE